MFALFFGIVYAVQLLKTLEPKKILTFYESVEEDDQYCDLFLSHITKSSNVYYRIIPPASTKKERLREDDNQSETEVADPEAFELPLERNVNEKLETPGLWTIQLYSRGNDVEKFSISSHQIKKVNKGDENILALRTALSSLQNAVEKLGNENYYAKHIQNTNIKEAERIKKTLGWLLLFPFITFGVAYAKYVLARQLVRPKGKRFKGLF
ncbi:hypothetical protein GINT2_001701 [Glugoides intestinalis]